MADARAETPICTAVLVCDAIYRDAATGKAVLAGVFNEVGAASFPFMQSLYVFFTLTNGRGEVDIKLRIEHDDGERVLEIGGPISILSPLMIIDHDVRLEGVPFQRPGKHWASIWSEEQLLGRRPFLVNLLRPDRGEEPQQ